MSKNETPNPLTPRWFYLNDANLDVAAWIKAQAMAYTLISQRFEDSLDIPISLDNIRVVFQEPIKYDPLTDSLVTDVRESKSLSTNKC